jgi:hypothetical protein
MGSQDRLDQALCVRGVAVQTGAAIVLGSRSISRPAWYLLAVRWSRASVAGSTDESRFAEHGLRVKAASRSGYPPRGNQGQTELVRVCFHFIDFGIAANTLEKFEKSERWGNCFHDLFQSRTRVYHTPTASVVQVVHFRTVSVTYPCDTGVILRPGGAKNDCDWCPCRSGLGLA